MASQAAITARHRVRMRLIAVSFSTNLRLRKQTKRGLMPTAVIERTPNATEAAKCAPPMREAERTQFAPGQSREKVEPGAPAIDHRTGKYLTFLLGREEFAIQVLKVREIMGIQDITAVPQTPQYVKGVINLRGKVIPVVDLRLKFCLPEIEYTQRTCIIVVQVQSAGVALHTGIIVDAVSEVLNLAAADIEDTPDFGDGCGSAASYLLGMAKVKGKVKILLDIDRVLSAQEVHGLDALAHN
jgi:purine-binding chemotaxis protein CheW